MKGWLLSYQGFDPQHEPLREALCTLGNGYFATRGAAEESRAGGAHYPGTYLAGGYDRLESEIAGRVIVNEDLVNVPNWLPLTFRIEDGDWYAPGSMEILDYRQELDMRHGILRREMRLRDGQGRETSVVTRRVVHMELPHLAAIEYALTPVNWSGSVRLRSALDGSVINSGVARYRALSSKHLEVLASGACGEDAVFLLARTVQSRLEIAQAARTRLYRGGSLQAVGRATERGSEWVAQELSSEARAGETLVAEKIVALYTSRDAAISEAGLEAREAAARCGRFADLLGAHTRCWRHLWQRCDVEIHPPREEQVILRLHAFHLLQTVSTNSIGLDVGVPARGLHGEAYRGHIFWDELFIFPFYNLRIPEITRGLLLYRFRRLNAARRQARAAGYRGAMYPWQSGSNGQEETQVVHLNPRSGQWGADHSRNQRHVNAAIAYNVWQYYQVTEDRSFLARYGAEMLLEIARFLSSLCSFNGSTGRFEIHGVMGPDEYHEKYPDAEESGLSNNAYTNVMTVWVLDRALDALELLSPRQRAEVVERLALGDDEIRTWREITFGMTVPFHDGVISQFEGYDRLQDVDWEGLRARHGSVERLDRVLKAEGDSPDRYRASKQADVLMLFYLLPRKTLKRIFQRLGYPFDDQVVRRTVEYYTGRTSHGSTLSRVVHASILDRFDRSAAWQLFCRALRADVSDVQGGTTPEGIHLGAMSGTVDIVLQHYAGIDTTRPVIAFHPRLPEALESVRLRVRHRGRWYDLAIERRRFALEVDSHGLGPVPVIICGTQHILEPGQRFECSLPHPSPARPRP